MFTLRDRRLWCQGYNLFKVSVRAAQQKWERSACVVTHDECVYYRVNPYAGLYNPY